jgi:5-methylcytosine-specific restriction endonuclease McrA
MSTSVPRAVREQVWLKHNGPVFSAPCAVKWCNNEVTAFTFSTGHDVPKSKGGSNKISNLFPICCRCNSCMGNLYTISDWNEAF